MTDEIVFYHNPQSRSQMVRWMIEEAGAPHRVVPIDFAKNEHKAPAFLALLRHNTMRRQISLSQALLPSLIRWVVRQQRMRRL